MFAEGEREEGEDEEGRRWGRRGRGRMRRRIEEVRGERRKEEWEKEGRGRKKLSGGENGGTARASSLPISRAFIRLRDLGMNFATCNKLLLPVTDGTNVQRF